MLKSDIVQTDKHLNNNFASAEKSPMLNSHKYHKKPLTISLK